MKSSALVLLLALVGAQNVALSQTPAAKPQPSPVELMKLEKWEPLLPVAAAGFQADILKLEQAWWERVLLDPFRKRMASKPNADALANHVSTAMKFILDITPREDSVADALLAAAKAEMAAGMTDPLYLWTTAKTVNLRQRGWKDSLPLLELAYKNMGAGISSFLRFRICMSMGESRNGVQFSDPFYLEAAQELVDLQTEPGAFQGADHELYQEWATAFSNRFVYSHPEISGKVYLVKNFPDWLHASLEGRYEHSES